MTPLFLPAPVTQHRPIDTVRGLSYTVPALAAGGMRAARPVHLLETSGGPCRPMRKTGGQIATHGRQKRMNQRT